MSVQLTCRCSGDEWFPVDKEGKIARGETSYIDTWKAMEKLLAKGKARAIGLSNFDQGQIQDIIDQCDVVSVHYTMSSCFC